MNDPIKRFRQIAERIPTLWRPPVPGQAGLFFAHQLTPRIEAHFERLERESAPFVLWKLVHNEQGRLSDARCQVAQSQMGARYEQFVEHGGLQGGMMDVAIIPEVLAAGASHVWAMEYDVDYSGDWSDFFSQFRTNSADVLTTTITPWDRCKDWVWWQSARMPRSVRRASRQRAFHPILRLSRRFAAAYAEAMRTGGWEGHYEFTIPTLARHLASHMEDIGGMGRFCPWHRRGRNYWNTPARGCLAPGTFVWRPPRSRYFHEEEGSFSERNMLHHPIKPDIEVWEVAKPA